MPVTHASTGDNMTLKLGNGVDGASTTYTEVAYEITNLPTPAMVREAKEATHLNSPNNWKEFIPSPVKGADAITIEFNYLPAHDGVLYALFLTGKGDLQIVYPNGVRLQFSAVVTGFKGGDGTGENMQGSITCQPTGEPDLLAA